MVHDNLSHQPYSVDLQHSSINSANDQAQYATNIFLLSKPLSRLLKWLCSALPNTSDAKFGHVAMLKRCTFLHISRSETSSKGSVKNILSIKLLFYVAEPMDDKIFGVQTSTNFNASLVKHICGDETYLVVLGNKILCSWTFADHQDCKTKGNAKRVQFTADRGQYKIAAYVLAILYHI